MGQSYGVKIIVPRGQGTARLPEIRIPPSLHRAVLQ
jgi:hypothetical protein